jgi:hypothetical protein
MATEPEARHRPPGFPSGDSRALAVLAAEPETIGERHGLHFFTAIDDLDVLRWAEVRLGDSSNAWLSKHQSDPNPGTVIRVDARADPAAARRALNAALQLQDGDVLWWAADA